MDEDAGEEEMEWLMEELEAPPTSSTLSSQRGRSHHSNGHITTKSVNTDGLRSFTLDDQEDDSEDEVLSVPGVRVVKPSAASRDSAAHRSVFLQVSLTSCFSSDGCNAPCGGCWYRSAAGSYRMSLDYWQSPIIGFQEESDEDLVGLLEESDRKKSGKLRLSAITHGNSAAANRKREEDDSDEDLLRV